jgi:hypothetical protein
MSPRDIGLFLRSARAKGAGSLQAPRASLFKTRAGCDWI